MHNMTFSKVHKKGMGYAKEKNDGKIKACSKA
jgi:hypothetical protein